MAAFVYDPPLPDGVYLGLPHVRYFGQETRGSSDWIDLHKKKWGWWWSSPYNPRRRRVQTVEQNYGSALHVIILEGLGPYERQYAVVPDKGDYADLLVSEEDIRKALEKAGWSTAGRSSWKKRDWVHLAVDKLDQPVWDAILQDFEANTGPEVERLNADEDHMLRFMRDMVLSEDRNDNATIRRLLGDHDDHPPLAEVSIFATVEGIRRRWRIDRWFPALNLDLKSLGAWSGRPLAYEAGDVLARRRWSIQRADYDVGRATAYQLVREGKLFGGSLEQRRYLERIVEEETRWDWAWLVYQKPDPVRGVAPILMPIWDDWDSDLAKSGAKKLAAAIRFYKAAVAEFGLHQAWGRVESLHYTRERYDAAGHILPRVSIPHWEESDDPAEDAAYEKEPNE